MSWLAQTESKRVGQHPRSTAQFSHSERASASNALRSSPSTNAVDRRQLSILWIDDEPDRALSVLLLEHRILLDWATTGSDGLERAATAGYDAIVVDVRLEDMSGLTVVRRLGKFDARPPTLIVTGHYLEDEVRQQAWQLGAAVAYKPFLDASALASALRVIAERRGCSPLLNLRPGELATERRVSDEPNGRLVNICGSVEAEMVAVSRTMRDVVDWIGHAPGPTPRGWRIRGTTRRTRSGGWGTPGRSNGRASWSSSVRRCGMRPSGWPKRSVVIGLCGSCTWNWAGSIGARVALRRPGTDGGTVTVVTT